MPELSTKHWFTALLIALVAHLALAAIWPDQDAVIEGGAKDVGEGGVEVGIGLAGTGGGFADLPDEVAKPVEQKKPIEQAKPVEKVTEKPQEKKPKKLRVEKPVVPVSQAVAPVVAAAISAEKKTSANAASAAVAVAKDATHFSEGATGDGTGPAGDGGAGNRAGRGGLVSEKQNYYGKLALWLAKHKRYPREAKKSRITGLVTVRFTIGSDGELLSYELVKSSQQPLLDEAAVAMLKLASPFPAIPPQLGVSQLTVTLPVEYSLKR